MTICVQVFVQTSPFGAYLACVLSNRIVESYGNSVMSILGSCQMDAQFYVPTSNVRRFQFLCVPTLAICFLNFSHHNGLKCENCILIGKVSIQNKSTI